MEITREGLGDLSVCDANYVALTPISFLERAAKICPLNTSCVIHHNDTDNNNHHLASSWTWKQTHQRCTQIASALSSHFEISYGDPVAAIAPNIPELYEVHFAVPMAGGILSTLNPRLDAFTLGLILEQLQPKVVFITEQHLKLLVEAIKTWPPLVLFKSNDHHVSSNLSLDENSPTTRSLYYSELLNMGRLDFEVVWPKHECDPILVNYTSGSTGIPKGVVYSHRAVYLNTLGEILRSDLRDETLVFLWTADMFRANGWGFTWAVAALAATNVFLSDPTGPILASISMHSVNHLSGHPSILFKILEEVGDVNDVKRPLAHKVYAHIAGTLPPSDTVMKIQDMGFEIVHRYGMTEVLGAPVNRFWKLDPATKSLKLQTAAAGSTSNILNHMMEEFDVKDPELLESVRCDGKTVGEVMCRGNAVMTGYFKAPAETKRVFEGGWFHTGDLAVKHQDGCIQLKDRANDIIKVCEGDSISSLEVEAVLLTHPKISEAAVVAMPKPCNGDHNLMSSYEVPCAFVKLKNGAVASPAEMVSYCRERLPKEMIPQLVIFGNLTTNSTGKVQKFILRDLAKTMTQA